MKKFLLFFFLCNLANAESCNVELFSKIYRLEAGQTFGAKDVIYKTHCAAEINLKISQIISNVNGVVSASFIEKEFPNVSVTPRKIALLDLNTYFKEQLTAKTNLHFLDTKPMNQIRTLSLLETETAKPQCENCSGLGEKNIKIEVNNPLDGTKKTLWFTSKVMAKVKVLKAKRNLSFQDKNLSLEDFYTEEVLSSMPQNNLSNLENIHYYKPNKNIMEGAIVSNMDLQPINLVNYGTPIKVILKNSNINLIKTAMPGRSAQFGDTIEVQTGNNNKKILGRVIDYNKVVIEL